MIVALYIYIDGIAKRIELFDDEKISITSSIQNINDISKVFTDYSQSFTIPAGATNNDIFKHWYENSLDNGFDQRLRYDGYIEIDTQTFRVGKWQLESASVKNNRIEDYKITFYGNLKSLTDKFGEDKLKDIETLNDYTIEYSGINVENLVKSSTDEDVMFPLISSNRVWQYGSGGSDDISTSVGAINYNELFPAIKVARVFDAIETKYGVSFDGSFLSQEKFTKAYIWLKDGETTSLNPINEMQIIDFEADYSDSYMQVNATTNELIVLGFPLLSAENDYKFNITITFPISVTSTLSVYKNGTLYTSVTQTGTTISFEVNESTDIGAYTFYIQSNVSTTYNFNYEISYYEYVFEGTSGTVVLETRSGSGGLNSNLDLTALAPDIKVADFFSGILKMFNLTAYSIDGVNFTLEQLENWYYLGSIKDFSEYCTTDLEYNRIKPFKKIDFKYQKSESLLNREFYDNNVREYGDLLYGFPYDGSDYTIQLPFENLLFNKFTGTNLQVGYILKTDLKPYKPKPIILYFTGNYSGSFYLNNGFTNSTISVFNIFGQDMISSSLNNTLNWGVEISSFFLENIYNSLFNNYYVNYLNNLYLLKSRMVKVKMRLPYNELINLKLNDRIVIRGNRYIINQYTTDLTTFESDFELVQDFRDITLSNSFLRQTDNTGKTLRFDTVSTEPLTWSVYEDDNFQIISIDNNSSYVSIDIKSNTTGSELVYSIKSNKDDLIIIRQDA